MEKSRKKAYLISCSDHYGHRLWAMDKVLKEEGYDTVYITSDFDHNTKETFKCKEENCLQIHAKPYKKNLSADRILSHMLFARDVFSYIEKNEEPDLIYCLVPPNFLAHYGAKYKAKHKNVKLVFDIFDLWPETFPSGKLKKLLAPVFSVWGWVRNHALPKADFVVTECEMFKERLKLGENSAAIYLCQNKLDIPVLEAELDENELNLCYLGSINNIISIPHIENVIRNLSQKTAVKFHIIGGGEKQDELVSSAENAGAQVVFYGPVYDDVKKQEIMSRCHFGLNIMKESVCVGLTMKSVDYFRHGLPIINNIPADTERFVAQKGIGVSLSEDDFCNKVLCGNEKCLLMRQNVRELFDSTFDYSQVKKSYLRILNELR